MATGKVLDHEPTPVEVDMLHGDAGEHYLFAGAKYLQASRCDDTNFYVTCPWCFTKYKKDGTPTARARRKEHMHGWTEQAPGYYPRENANCRGCRDRGYYVCVTTNTPGMDRPENV